MILELPMPWKELKVSIPISIGSVPLQHNFDSFLPPKEFQDKENAQSLPGVKYDNLRECFFYFNFFYFKLNFIEINFLLLQAEKL